MPLSCVLSSDYVPARNSFRATKPTIVREFEPRKQVSKIISYYKYMHNCSQHLNVCNMTS